MPSINTDLHLVLPLRSDADGTPYAYAYHSAISLQVFEANYRTLAATKAALFAQGPRYAFEVGSQVAALHLRDAGRKDAGDRLELNKEGEPGDGGVDALLAEMRRLTMVAIPSAAGWESVPLDVAQQRGALDAEDMREVENAIVFFTSIFYLTPRRARASIAGTVASAAGGSITSLSLTDWTASLRTSTPVIASEAPAA